MLRPAQCLLIPRALAPISPVQQLFSVRFKFADSAKLINAVGTTDGDFSIGFKGLSIGAKRSETSSGSSETAYGSRVASITAAYANVQQLAQSLPAAITQQVGAATSAFQATIESYKVRNK